MDNEKRIIVEDALKNVSGGAGTSDACVEYPIMIETDEKVEKLVSEAQKCSFKVRVSDRKSSADAKDLEQVKALDRSWTVICHAECSNTDYFARVVLAGLAW